MPKKTIGSLVLDVDKLPHIGEQFEEHREIYIRHLKGDRWVDIAKDYGITASAVRERSHLYEVKARRMIRAEGVCPLCGCEVKKDA